MGVDSSRSQAETQPGGSTGGSTTTIATDFFGLKITAAGKKASVRRPVKIECDRRTRDGLCTKYQVIQDCCRESGTESLNFNGVKRVVFESHGVKAKTKNYKIVTKSAGNVTVLKDWSHPASAPTGSGLRTNHEYKNTQYDFELQPGAKVTLSMEDNEVFDLVSFDVSYLELP